MERKEFVKILGVGAVAMAMGPIAFSKGRGKKSDFDTCKLAWEKLCGNIGEVYKTDCFSYVHPEKKVPNVLIYGDSISIKYSSQARENLKGKATLFRLFKNGGSSGHFIQNMNKMNEEMFQPGLEKGLRFKWDMIHFNVGLHDLKYLKGKHLNKKGTQVSSISQYKTNLDEICKYLGTNYPKAKLIFATTTEVPANAKGRFQGDSVKYNEAAMEVLANYPDIAINDLYTFTNPYAEEWAEAPGNVHYNEEGYTKQGVEVARVIAENL